MAGTGRVLVVGGGIAGLSLDLALRGGPWQVELVEREAGCAAGHDLQDRPRPRALRPGPRGGPGRSAWGLQN